jgi:hypothetical protein
MRELALRRSDGPGLEQSECRAQIRVLAAVRRSRLRRILRMTSWGLATSPFDPSDNRSMAHRHVALEHGLCSTDAGVRVCASQLRLSILGGPAVACVCGHR